MPVLKYLVMPNAWLQMLDKKTSELHPLAKKLRRLIEDDEQVFVTGLIMHEVLHHVRDRRQKEKVFELLSKMHYIELTKADFLQASLYKSEDLFGNIHAVAAAKVEAQILE
jgi:UDP-N-acetylglucosamine 2-epimerase